MDCSPLGSSIHGIFQARALEWVAISFSRGSSWPRDWTQISHTAGRRFTIWATREVQNMTLGCFQKSSLPLKCRVTPTENCVSQAQLGFSKKEFQEYVVWWQHLCKKVTAQDDYSHVWTSWVCLISQGTFIFCWEAADEHCCGRFRWTAESLSHSYTCMHSPRNSPPCQAAA